jgi:hypothetical protein
MLSIYIQVSDMAHGPLVTRCTVVVFVSVLVCCIWNIRRLVQGLI